MIEYKIYSSVYDEMISGKKRIEIRLLNEKSNNIKNGDIIQFNVLNTTKHLLVQVTGRYIFDNIDELWENKDIVLTNTLNYNKEEFTEQFHQIFGQEKVNSSKIIGIEFEIIKNNNENRKLTK